MFEHTIDLAFLAGYYQVQGFCVLVLLVLVGLDDLEGRGPFLLLWLLEFYDRLLGVYPVE